MMKSSTLLFAILLTLFWACGGSSTTEPVSGSDTDNAKNAQLEMMKKMGASDAEIAEMKNSMEKLAKNVEEMEAEGEESDELLSDKTIQLLGLTTTERKISDEAWKNASVLRVAWKKLTNEELSALTLTKIEEILLSANYTDVEVAKSSLRQISEGTNFITSVTMKIAMLKSTRILDGTETYEQEMKELGAKINERGYSAEDIKLMDNSAKISGTVTEILYRMDHL